MFILQVVGFPCHVPWYWVCVNCFMSFQSACSFLSILGNFLFCFLSLGFPLLGNRTCNCLTFFVFHLLIFWDLLWEISALYFLLFLFNFYSWHLIFNIQLHFFCHCSGHVPHYSILSLFQSYNIFSYQNIIILLFSSSLHCLCFLHIAVFCFLAHWFCFAVCLLCSNFWRSLLICSCCLLVCSVGGTLNGNSTSMVGLVHKSNQPGHFLEIPIVWISPGFGCSDSPEMNDAKSSCQHPGNVVSQVGRSQWSMYTHSFNPPCINVQLIPLSC